MTISEKETREILVRALFERGQAYPIKYVDRDNNGVDVIVFGSYLDIDGYEGNDQYMPWQLLLRPDLYPDELHKLAERMSRERQWPDGMLTLASAILHDDVEGYLRTCHPDTLAIASEKSPEAMFLGNILWLMKDELDAHTELEQIAAMASHVRGIGHNTRDMVHNLADAGITPTLSAELHHTLRQGNCSDICRHVGMKEEETQQIAALYTAYASTPLGFQISCDWVAGIRILKEQGLKSPSYDSPLENALFVTNLGREQRIQTTIQNHTANIRATIDRHYEGNEMAFAQEAWQLGEEMAADFMHLPSYALEDMLETKTYVVKQIFSKSDMKRVPHGSTTTYGTSLIEVAYSNDHVTLNKNGEITALAHEYMGHVMHRATGHTYLHDMPEEMIADIDRAADVVSAAVREFKGVFCPEPYTFDAWKRNVHSSMLPFFEGIERNNDNIADCWNIIARYEQYIVETQENIDIKQQQIQELEQRTDLAEWEQSRLDFYKRNLISDQEDVASYRMKINKIQEDDIATYQSIIDKTLTEYINPGHAQLVYIAKLEAIADAHIPPEIQGEARIEALNDACRQFHHMAWRMNLSLFMHDAFTDDKGERIYNVIDPKSRWYKGETHAPIQHDDHMASAEIMCNVIGVLVDPQILGPSQDEAFGEPKNVAPHVAMMRSILSPMIDVIERPGGYIDLCKQRAASAREARQGEEELMQLLQEFKGMSTEKILTFRSHEDLGMAAMRSN